MARRSSARLRERSTTPKRVSLSHDAPMRTPKTLPAKLTSLQESDEMPGAFPQSVSPSLMMEVERDDNENENKTPHRTPIQPTSREMHPQLHHQSTAKPLDEARHLGFSNMHMHPQTEPAPRHQTSRLAAMQGTPTRNFEKDLKSPSYEFTFRREHSLELSPEAKKLMYEKREEAAKIKKQMIADGEGVQSIDEVLGRKKATPGGRYSSVHDKQFAKMGSIANHPSAFRADPNRVKMVSSAAVSATKSLKRSPSKADLDAGDRTPSSRPSSRDTSKPTPSFKGSALPRSTSTNDLRASASPAKRVKRDVNEDVSATRPASKDGEKSLPSTPQTHKKQQPSYPDLSHLTTPTQSSLSRAASVKSTKTSKIPGPQFTPGKVAFAPLPAVGSTHKQPVRSQDHSTPLLHRSPSKPSFFSKPSVEKTEVEKVEKPKSMMDPHLARTPAKAGFLKKAVAFEEHANSPREKPAPLLSRSPVKAPVAKTHETDSPQVQKTAPVPFLSRSPSKIPMTGPNNPFSTTTSTTASETPGKSTATKLLGRFNLLRQSPMKSILRSPQRLYSDDPSKIAAGTHMATPPKKTSSSSSSAQKHETASVRKRVDFSSSTKNGESRGPSVETPVKSVGKPERTVSMLPVVDYPAIPREDRMLSPSPQKRRETAGPGDFTFRADEHGLVFQSPNAAATTSGTKRANTIRFVQDEPIVLSATPAPATGSKKRKHEFEDRAAVEEMNGVTSDKENSEDVVEEAEERPAKRMKASMASPVKPTTAGGMGEKKGGAVEKKRSTLGVKPKGARSMPPAKAKTSATTGGVKKTSSAGGSAGGGATTISQARLNALSQPKKR